MNNNYNITYNSLSGKWQVSHNLIGFCAEFDSMEQAVEYTDSRV